MAQEEENVDRLVDILSAIQHVIVDALFEVPLQDLYRMKGVPRLADALAGTIAIMWQEGGASTSGRAFLQYQDIQNNVESGSYYQYSGSTARVWSQQISEVPGMRSDLAQALTDISVGAVSKVRGRPKTTLHIPDIERLRGQLRGLADDLRSVGRSLNIPVSPSNGIDYIDFIVKALRSV